MNIRRVVLLLGVAATVAACSSPAETGGGTSSARQSTPSATTGGSPDGTATSASKPQAGSPSGEQACALLSTEEIEQTMATTVTFREAETTPGTYAPTADMCRWEVAGTKTEQPQVVVTLETDIGDQRAKVQADFDDAVTKGGARRLDGLGDIAVQLPEGAIGILLGTTGLEVSADTGDPAADGANTLALARLAVSRIR